MLIYRFCTRTLLDITGTTHINLGGFGECAHWMHVVIQYDDAHHYSQAEGHCLFICKPASVFPGRQNGNRVRHITELSREQMPPPCDTISSLPSLKWMWPWYHEKAADRAVSPHTITSVPTLAYYPLCLTGSNNCRDLSSGLRKTLRTGVLLRLSSPSMMEKSWFTRATQPVL